MGECSKRAGPALGILGEQGLLLACSKKVEMISSVLGVGGPHPPGTLGMWRVSPDYFKWAEYALILLGGVVKLMI